MKIFRKIFHRDERNRSDFSEFFTNTNVKEKERVLRDVVRKANEDQKIILDKYERMKI
jgi:hypothetical protein